MDALHRLGSEKGCGLQISAYAFSPRCMTGVQTISYELAEQIPEGIDHVFCPAGGGGLTLAVARGFETLTERGRLSGKKRSEERRVGKECVSTCSFRGAPDN